jgi:trehalose 6-phosphate phosphatase
MTEVSFCGCIPVFLGDNCTDEHGFQVVNRLSGYSVKVGPGRSAACYRLASSAAMRDWLHGYLEWIACHRSAGRGTAA